jgi:hypothetical protein
MVPSKKATPKSGRDFYPVPNLFSLPSALLRISFPQWYMPNKSGASSILPPFTIQKETDRSKDESDENAQSG